MLLLQAATEAAHGWTHTLPSFVAPGVLLASFLLALVNFFGMRGVELHGPIVQTYFSWIPVGDLQIDAALLLDPLSMIMVLIITGVGFLIHVFSVGSKACTAASCVSASAGAAWSSARITMLTSAAGRSS